MALNIEKLLKMSEPQLDDALQTVQEDKILWLPVSELQVFPSDKHRFRPATGQRLVDLQESIRANGILNPLLIRQLSSGVYQILAGHNRRTAAKNIGYKDVPCILKDAPSDDEALLIVINDNLHNRDLLPSERGWAYRDEMEIRGRRQGQRMDLTCGQSVHKLSKTRDNIDKNTSGRNVARYIRLTYLIEPLLELVDQSKIGLSTGEQLSYLSRHSQQIVYDFCYAVDPMKPLKEAQAKALREVEVAPDRIIDEDLLEELTAKKQTVRFRTLKLEMSQLRKYFPVGTPEEVVKQTIQTALAIYFEKEDDN